MCFVSPAQAGIQGFGTWRVAPLWVPACAGMTTSVVTYAGMTTSVVTYAGMTTSVVTYAGMTTLVVTFFTSSKGTLVVCNALAGRPSFQGKSTG